MGEEEHTTGWVIEIPSQECPYYNEFIKCIYEKKHYMDLGAECKKERCPIRNEDG